VTTILECYRDLLEIVKADGAARGEMISKVAALEAKVAELERRLAEGGGGAIASIESLAGDKK